MPSKYYLRQFVPDNYYHIFNRGTRKSVIFHDESDYITFIDILSYYLTYPNGIAHSRLKNKPKTQKIYQNTKPYLLIAYCLMPNHFHLMVQQQNSDITIINLMKRLTISYSMYYHDKYDLSGTLFESKYKNVHIKSDSQFLYLTKYIHRNPLKLPGTEPGNLHKYPYSSYPNYLQHIHQPWVNPQEILSFFSQTIPSLTYQSFVQEELSDKQVLAIKHLTIDD